MFCSVITVCVCICNRDKRPFLFKWQWFLQNANDRLASEASSSLTGLPSGKKILANHERHFSLSTLKVHIPNHSDPETFLFEQWG